MDLYQQNILDYYRRPRCQGAVANATNIGAAANPLCGDRIGYWLLVSEGKIIQTGWEGDGCVLSLASADMLAEYLMGRSLSEVVNLNKENIVNMLGVKPSPSRCKCALLPLEAFKQSLIKN